MLPVIFCCHFFLLRYAAMLRHTPSSFSRHTLLMFIVICRRYAIFRFSSLRHIFADVMAPIFASSRLYAPMFSLHAALAHMPRRWMMLPLMPQRNITIHAAAVGCRRCLLQRCSIDAMPFADADAAGAAFFHNMLISFHAVAIRYAPPRYCRQRATPRTYGLYAYAFAIYARLRYVFKIIITAITPQRMPPRRCRASAIRFAPAYMPPIIYRRRDIRPPLRLARADTLLRHADARMPRAP